MERGSMIFELWGPSSSAGIYQRPLYEESPKSMQKYILPSLPPPWGAGSENGISVIYGFAPLLLTKHMKKK